MYNDTDYKKMYSPDNIKRAYRWIQSNPDAYYKSYFRDSYNAYASASKHNLLRIRRMLANGSYEPTNAAKIFLPKPSGVLRPHTLLTVNDQIVYQACINIIAEKLKSQVKHRYEKTIFGHLYAGKKSQFFYLKWQDGYQKFSNKVFNNVDSGYNYVANFDLASFYDSIDHHVLRHFLEDVNVGRDLVDFLLKCLTKWTSCTWTNIENTIYHGHGIPQGPLSSGLLSEIVLSHFDSIGSRSKKTKYLRYVDDIKIFAKTEGVLRQRLISLDIAAKEIGLFPQSAKINIRKVINARDEVKTISSPVEDNPFIAFNQKKVVSRILEVSRNGIVLTKNTTEFKYLLSQTNPTHKLNERLINLLPRNPHLSQKICSYFKNYDVLPKKASEAIVKYLKKEEIYHSVHADLLISVIDNMPSPYKEECVEYCYKCLFNRHENLPPPQPSYKASLLAWLIVNNKFTYSELEESLLNEKNWWIQKTCLKFVSKNQYGEASYQVLLNSLIKNSLSPDSARAAAMHIVENNLKVTIRQRDVDKSARPTLFVGKKIKKIGKDPSLINDVLIYVLSSKRKTTPVPKCNWKLFFGEQHDHAERLTFTIKHNYEADINSCLVTLDSFCDLVFEGIYKILMPNKTYGNYGGMLGCKAIKNKFPEVANAFYNLHELRKQSHTAHPRIKHSNIKPRRLKHSDLYKIRPDLIKAFTEIALEYPLQNN